MNNGAWVLQFVSMFVFGECEVFLDLKINILDMIDIASTQSMCSLRMTSVLLVVCPLMYDMLVEGFRHFGHFIVNIFILMCIHILISMIIIQMFYCLSWIYGKYNFILSNTFEMAMMINSRIFKVFFERLNFSWNGIIWNGLSHIQWALSLVVDVRRFDFNFSWNGQEWLSFVTSTMSFVLMWVFCSDSTMVYIILFYFIVLSFIVVGISMITVLLYHYYYNYYYYYYHDRQIKVFFINHCNFNIITILITINIICNITYYDNYLSLLSIFHIIQDFLYSMVCCFFVAWIVGECLNFFLKCNMMKYI